MQRHHKAEPHVPFIALADIGWQIIIFFLVAASFTMNDAVNISLPSGTNQPQAQAESNITVQASENTLMIDGRSVEITELQPQLKSMLTGKTTETGKAVVVAFKDDVTFQRNAEILYAIQKAGGTIIFSEDGQ
jgi:biopolymer transport protein ExbD